METCGRCAKLISNIARQSMYPWDTRASRKAAILCVLFTAVLCFVPSAHSQEGIDFFERKIRPVLVHHCYSCHSVEAKKNRGDLYVDSKEGLLQGGEKGPAIVPGHPEKSLLIKAIRYTEP